MQVRRVLEKAIDALPDPFRIVFVLRDVEGMSTEETASHLSIRIETVKTRLHRARRLMRSAIEKELSGAFLEVFPFDGSRCAQMADRVMERLRQLGPQRGGIDQRR
jgi:RNA polymerase sigma-70 factor (ECF subfamily)